MAVAVEDAGLSPDDVVAVARGREAVVLGDRAVDAMARSRAIVDRLAESGAPVYGVSTGFGALATMFIPAERRAQLQRSLIRSHAAGMGPPVEAEVVRAMMLLRVRSLAMGFSGTRPEVAANLVALLNAGITPVVPEHGSLGCSGDLAPLAHVALVLMGEGEAVGPDDAGRLDGAAALAAAGVAPLELSAKEGLALVNGTDAAFAQDLLALRPQPGQQSSAANLRRLLAGSAIVASHRDGDPRVQDAYSMRCAPQVAGAARDTLAFVRGVVDHELAAAIDNPVVLPDGRVASNGNFHGAPLAAAADYLAIAAQYTAAALVAENRRLAVPASVDSIPTSAMQEDHVSMGWAAARKLRVVLANLARIFAVELVAAARALDLRAPLTPAPGTAAVLDRVRRDIAGPGPDRFVAAELAASEALVRSGDVVRAAESVVGPLA